MLKTAINPANLQEHLESARNASQKGQAQYCTPVAWAAALTKGLPNYRPNLVDFSCGHGTLLAGAAGPSTDYLMGCDIEDIAKLEIGDWQLKIKKAFVNADVTKFFPLLRRVHWQFDCGVFNPPWDLHQYRERVMSLAESDCYAVRSAFAAHDGRTSKDTIDSTVLTLLMALDRMTSYGEAFIIGNQATFERLILGDGGRAQAPPHGALRQHIWANVIVPGNICQSQEPEARSQESEFRTGILYFARDHNEGFNAEDILLMAPGATPEDVAERFNSPDFRLARRGARLRPGCAFKESASLWAAAKEEWEISTGGTSSTSPKSKWNIYLDRDGTLRTYLSLFDDASGRVNKQEADRLFQLNGKQPLQLVMARETRRELERAVAGTRWRVAPAVTEAVAAAVADYNRERAPLYPLNKIQRLGYADELDTLLCVKALGPFAAGTRYEIETQTVRTKRAGTKMNLEGSLDDCEYDGSELAIYLVDSDGFKLLFMDARLMDASVTLSIQEEGEPSPINYTLHQLTDHFEIPGVPDVAILNPAGYERNLALLHEIEQLVA